MKKRRICITIIILVGVLLLGLILYHIPMQRQVSMYVCTETGETARVEMNYKYYRRLFRTPTVKGTMTFNGVEYIDEESLEKTFPHIVDVEHDWGEWFPKGADVFPDNMTFCKKSTATSQMEVFEDWTINRIVFMNVSGGDCFEKVCFAYTDESNTDSTGSTKGIIYYGPAQTIEEAKEIATSLGFKTSVE